MYTLYLPRAGSVCTLRSGAWPLVILVVSCHAPILILNNTMLVIKKTRGDIQGHPTAGVTCFICQERRLPMVGCWMYMSKDFDLRSRFMTFDDSQHLPHSAPSHHMVLSSRCPLDLCKSLYSSLYTPLYTIWRSGARFHARSVSS